MAKASPTVVPRWPRRQEGAAVCLLAHRGGRGPWRENTREAFAGALGLGADGVELDVRRTADGVLVVHHDAEIEGFGVLADLARRDLPAWVPTLGEALEVCARASVNVEIKNSPLEPGHDPTESVAAQVLEALVGAGDLGAGGRPAHVVVSSFSVDTISALASAITSRQRPGTGPAATTAPTPLTGSAAATAPPRPARTRPEGESVPSGELDVPFGLLVSPASDAVAALETAGELGCSSIHPFHLQTTPELVELAHEKGMAVVTWTVNDPEDMEAVLASGVDAVISDDVPGSLRAMKRVPPRA